MPGCTDLPQPHAKSFTPCYEGDGSPDCVAVWMEKVNNAVTVINSTQVFKMAARVFLEIYAGAVDRSTIISYWKRDPKDTVDSKSRTLRDMVAGASSSSSEVCEDAGQTKTIGNMIFEENYNRIIDDGVKDLLERADDEVFKHLQSKSVRRDGRRLCPTCPVRCLQHLHGLRTHIQKHHVEKTQYFCSGTRQIKVILALFEHAASSHASASSLLQDSRKCKHAAADYTACSQQQYQQYTPAHQISTSQDRDISTGTLSAGKPMRQASQEHTRSWILFSERQ